MRTAILTFLIIKELTMIRHSLLLSTLAVGLTLTLGLFPSSAFAQSEPPIECPDCKKEKYRDSRRDSSSEFETLDPYLIPD